MSLAAVRYGFYVDDGVAGEIVAETMPGGQGLTDEQKALLERIQQLVAQAQAALTSSAGAEAMASGVKLANAVNGLKTSLANFQTAIKIGNVTQQKSTAESVVGAATEFQKTLEGLKTVNPNAAIPANLKALGASLASLKDMMSQKAQVGKITRTAILRGGVTDLAAARILSAIRAIIGDKTQPQALRDTLAAVSKALDTRKAAGQPLTVKDIVVALAGKGQDAVNAVVMALAAAKQPAATQAFVAALANIPEKGPQMAAQATLAVAQVSQQIAVQVIIHVATVNPQAAAQIMTVVAAAQPAIIQSVAQAAINSEKPSIVAMALAALTEVKQQQPAATQAIQNITATLADKGQPAINAVAIALAEMKQPAAAQALQAVIATLSETKPQMAAQAIAELAKANPQIAAKVITQLAEANPQTAKQIMTAVAAVQPNVIQAIARQTVRGEPSPLAAAAQAGLREVKWQQSGRVDSGKGELGQTQPLGGGVSLADIKTAGAAITAERSGQQKPVTPNLTATSDGISVATGKLVPLTPGTVPVNVDTPKGATITGGPNTTTVNTSVEPQSPKAADLTSAARSSGAAVESAPVYPTSTSGGPVAAPQQTGAQTQTSQMQQTAAPSGGDGQLNGGATAVPSTASDTIEMQGAPANPQAGTASDQAQHAGNALLEKENIGGADGQKNASHNRNDQRTNHGEAQQTGQTGDALSTGGTQGQTNISHSDNDTSHTHGTAQVSDATAKLYAENGQKEQNIRTEFIIHSGDCCDPDAKPEVLAKQEAQREAKVTEALKFVVDTPTGLETLRTQTDNSGVSHVNQTIDLSNSNGAKAQGEVVREKRNSGVRIPLAPKNG